MFGYDEAETHGSVDVIGICTRIPLAVVLPVGEEWHVSAA
jgi:hypothetical protein